MNSSTHSSPMPLRRPPRSRWRILPSSHSDTSPLFSFLFVLILTLFFTSLPVSAQDEAVTTATISASTSGIDLLSAVDLSSGGLSPPDVSSSSDATETFPPSPSSSSDPDAVDITSNTSSNTPPVLDPNLLWGPFRPDHYLGMRPTIPDTLLMTLLWANATTDLDALSSKMRDRSSPADGGLKFSWSSYDPRQGGTQVFADFANGIDLSTQLVKFPNDTAGGGHWAVRVTGTPMKVFNPRQRTLVAWNIAMESMYEKEGRSLTCGLANSTMGCAGRHPELGGFVLKQVLLDGNRLAESPKVLSLKESEDTLWQGKPVFIDKLNKSSTATYTLDKPGRGNMHYLQAVFIGSFSFDIIYTSNSYEVPLNSTSITVGISGMGPNFRTNFENVFPITHPYNHTHHGVFARHLFSNLFAGLGYFHGSLEISSSSETDEETNLGPALVEQVTPSTLLSFTPSRRHYPYGHLEDEGFHLLLVQEWDFDLAVETFRSWLSTNKDGWIAKEQILGPELLSSIPEEAQVQDRDVAAPPTLLAITLPKLLLKLQGQEKYRGHVSKHLEDGKAAMRALYPDLQAYYAWFRKEQEGDMTNYPDVGEEVKGYRWRDCAGKGTGTAGEEGKESVAAGTCHASGMWDYPRPVPDESEEDVLHVDLLAWLGASARAMQSLAAYLGDWEGEGVYQGDLESVWLTLGTVHWDEDAGVWCDTSSNSSGLWRRECRVGYVSLMPFFLGLVDPNAGRLERVVEVMSDKFQLWSPYGLRSLSRLDAEYGNDTYAYRGNVYTSYNVLASLQLKHVSSLGTFRVHKEALQLALELRNSIIATAWNLWQADDRFEVWERYGDRDGGPGRVDGFTGWTSCLLLLMGMVRDEEGVEVIVQPSNTPDLDGDGEISAEEQEVQDQVVQEDTVPDSTAGGKNEDSSSEGDGGDDDDTTDEVPGEEEDGDGGGEFSLSLFALGMGVFIAVLLSWRHVLAGWMWVWRVIERDGGGRDGGESDSVGSVVTGRVVGGGLGVVIGDGGRRRTTTTTIFR